MTNNPPASVKPNEKQVKSTKPLSYASHVEATTEQTVTNENSIIKTKSLLGAQTHQTTRERLRKNSQIKLNQNENTKLNKPREQRNVDSKQQKQKHRLEATKIKTKTKTKRSNRRDVHTQTGLLTTLLDCINVPQDVSRILGIVATVERLDHIDFVLQTMFWKINYVTTGT